MNKQRLFAYLLLSVNFILMIALLFFVVIPTAFAASCFTDTEGHWAETYICWLFDNGISAGFPDGTFRPADYVNRAQMAVFLQQLSGNGTAAPVVNANTLDSLDSADFSPAYGVPKSCQWRVVKEVGDELTIADCSDVGTSFYAVSGGCYSADDTLETCFPIRCGLRYGDGAATCTYPETDRADGWYGRWKTSDNVHEVAVLCCQWGE